MMGSMKSILEKACQKMQGPYIRHKVSVEAKFYGNKDSNEPLAAISMNDEQQYTLLRVAEVVGTVVLFAWSLRLVKHILHPFS